MLVESHSDFIEGINHQSVGCNLGAGRSIQGISEKRATQPLPLE
jgi:hypothetical protein